MSKQPVNHVEQCWVDVFTGQAFAGNRVRVSTASAARSQTQINELETIRSVIVGPNAIVILASIEGSKRSYRVLMPGSVVPDFDEGDLPGFN
jgi:hypothetical protein